MSVAVSVGRLSLLAGVVVSMLGVGVRANLSPDPGDHFWSLIDDPLFNKVSRVVNFDVGNLREICVDVFSPSSDPTEMEPDCEKKLTRILQSEPIWASVEFEYFKFGRGNRSLDSALDQRWRRGVSYGYGDYAMVGAPTWGEIFDSRLEQRMDAVRRTLNDEQCMTLGKHDGIMPEMAEHCQSDEMYRYAAYLDACATGKQRLALLRSQTYRSDAPSQTTYEASLDAVRGALPESERRRRITDLQTMIHLHASWVVRMCSRNPEVVVNANPPENGNSELTPEQAAKILQNTYDTILRIAAKAGQKRAMTTYYPVSERHGYWNDLYELEPHLVHRYLAAGHGPGWRLSDREKLVHGVRAHDMLKQHDPNVDMSLRSYLRNLNISVLSEEDLLYRDSGFTNVDVEVARQLVLIESWVLPWPQ